MGRQRIPAASSTQQITQHQNHPHPYLGGTSTSDGGGSSSMSGFRLISYNVLSDFKNAYQSHSTVKNWDTRRQLLLGEMLSYSPDVICLQDADHYQDWWRPQLTNRGIYVYIYMSPHRSWICGVHYHHHLIIIKLIIIIIIIMCILYIVGYDTSSTRSDSRQAGTVDR